MYEKKTHFYNWCYNIRSAENNADMHTEMLDILIYDIRFYFKKKKLFFWFSIVATLCF